LDRRPGIYMIVKSGEVSFDDEKGSDKAAEGYAG
jgi:hypothetical protein